MIQGTVEHYLEQHLAAYRARTGREPVVREWNDKASDIPSDVVYPLVAGSYAHIHPDGDELVYSLVEPSLSEHEKEEVEQLKDGMATEAAKKGDVQREGTLETALMGILRKLRPQTRDKDDPIAYHVLRDMARFGPIDALLKDADLEDIHVVGTTDVHVIHRRYGMLRTNIRFEDNLALIRFLSVLSERIGRPVSDAVPIVDATLPDGSRINLVYSEDVSRRGASLSIRRAADDPVSITQLINWNTLSSEAAGYLWLALENGMSMFLCGEAACGKTTTLNAILSFIDIRHKIYSAEDTPEVQPPHQIWQRLLTRETGPEASHVKMFDLLRAALRSRPDYIIVGEIRGAEGGVAFNAMQTGHPTVATFHATDATSLVQRLGAPPINIPTSFMDNLNVVLFQESRVKNGLPVRRVTSIVEIAGVSKDGVIAIPVFEYDAAEDRLVFKGRNNSYILEEKIATVLGMEETRGIYTEMERRAGALQRMADKGITNSLRVNNIITGFAQNGEEALPPEVRA